VHLSRNEIRRMGLVLFFAYFCLPYVRKTRQMASALALVSIVAECYKREEYLLVKMSVKIRQIESKLF